MSSWGVTVSTSKPIVYKPVPWSFAVHQATCWPIILEKGSACCLDVITNGNEYRLAYFKNGVNEINFTDVKFNADDNVEFQIAHIGTEKEYKVYIRGAYVHDKDFEEGTPIPTSRLNGKLMTTLASTLSDVATSNAQMISSLKRLSAYHKSCAEMMKTNMAKNAELVNTVHVSSNNDLGNKFTTSMEQLGSDFKSDIDRMVAAQASYVSQMEDKVNTGVESVIAAQNTTCENLCTKLNGLIDVCSSIEQMFRQEIDYRYEVWRERNEGEEVRVDNNVDEERNDEDQMNRDVDQMFVELRDDLQRCQEEIPEKIRDGIRNAVREEIGELFRQEFANVKKEIGSMFKKKGG